MDKSSIISEFIDGYWWLIIPDELWETKELVEWTEGIPWFIKNT